MKGAFALLFFLLPVQNDVRFLDFFWFTKDSIKPTQHSLIKKLNVGHKINIDKIITLNARIGRSDTTYKLKIISSPINSSPSANSLKLNSGNHIFSPDKVGTYKFQLIRINGKYQVLEKEFTFLAQDNKKPVANAGPDQSIKLGQKSILNGFHSYDPENISLQYKWFLIEHPPQSYSKILVHEKSRITFEPDVEGIYVFGLIVTDDIQASNIDTLVLTVTKGNSAPIANAGIDQLVFIGEKVILTGQQSYDADGDYLMFNWFISSSPRNSEIKIERANSVHAFFIPDKIGLYTIGLLVKDKTGKEHKSFINVTVSKKENLVPIAIVTSASEGCLDDEIILNGSKSYDSNDDRLAYKWEIVSKPETSTLEINSVDNAIISIKPDVVGEYVFELVVYDGEFDSEPSFAYVNITDENLAPIANASLLNSNTQFFKIGSIISLSAVDSYDPEGDDLVYKWYLKSKPKGSNALLSTPNNFQTNFNIDFPGDYLVALVVFDSQKKISNEFVLTILTEVLPEEISPPVADAGNDLIAFLGTTVYLQGGRSGNAKNQKLSYHWKQIKSPNGINMDIKNTATSAPSFVATQEGKYVLELTVMDENLHSHSDHISIIVKKPSLDLSWIRNYDYTKYLINLKKIPSNKSVLDLEIDGSLSSFHIENLQANTIYKLSLIGCNSSLCGEPIIEDNISIQNYIKN